MDPIALIVVLAILGVAVWAITTYLPMQQPFKNIIILIAILIALYMVAAAFGLTSLGSLRR